MLFHDIESEIETELVMVPKEQLEMLLMTIKVLKGMLAENNIKFRDLQHFGRRADNQEAFSEVNDPASGMGIA